MSNGHQNNYYPEKRILRTSTYTFYIRFIKTLTELGIVVVESIV
jgi:hypothetical protein